MQKSLYIHPATKDKICHGEFVDVFSLLFQEPDPKPWARCGAVA